MCKDGDLLPAWTRFPVLPGEQYTIHWLQRAGNIIGRTLKVDITTLMASREKFAHVCVELDLTKPLKAGYKPRGCNWRLQYEGLHSVCFDCGKYGHSRDRCLDSLKNSEEGEGEQQNVHQ